MISINKTCPPPSKPTVPWSAMALSAVATMSLAVLIIALFGRKEYQAAALVTYSLLATFFLGAQIFGFVRSQTHYSEEWEAAKFEMLEKEERH